MKADTKFHNKKLVTEGLPPVEPLYKEKMQKRHAVFFSISYIKFSGFAME